MNAVFIITYECCGLDGGSFLLNAVQKVTWESTGFITNE